MTLSTNIRTQRLRRGLGQQQVADAVGRSREAVAQWETGKKKPCVESLCRLAELFGVSVDGLLRGGADGTGPAAADGPAFSPDELEVVRLLRRSPPELRGLILAALQKIGTGRAPADGG